MRLSIFGTFGLVLVTSGCGPAPQQPMRWLTPYDLYVGRSVGDGEVPDCSLRSRPASEVTEVNPPGLNLLLDLPTTYRYGPAWAPLRDAHFPDGKWRLGQEWVPGIVVAAGAPWVTPWDGDHAAPRRFFSVVNSIGHSPVALMDGWKMVAMRECMDRLGTEPVRLLLFSASHPDLGEVHGISAYGRSPRSGGAKILALGPDEEAQAEFLAILRSAH